MNHLLFSVLVLFCVSAGNIQAQSPKKDSLQAEITTRYMSTNNRRDLTDFSILVTHGLVHYQRKMNDWLTLGGQASIVVNYGVDKISARDPETGKGPIYEANLWNTATMNGRQEMALPQLYARANFDRHTITVGRFLKNTPIINAEPWPFPNALEGLWYEYRKNQKWNFQLGSIFRIAPRQSGEFVNIGKSIGVASGGVDLNNQPSQYANNTNSSFLAIGNATYKHNDVFKVDAWNYYVDNVNNTFLLEPQLNYEATGWNLRGMFIYQLKVGEGGNGNPTFTYMGEGRYSEAMYFGLRAEKRINKDLFQFNFSRIADQGRLLLPREWGKEPFYTFQRRTRIEGALDVTAVTVKWQRAWENEERKWRLFTSVGKTRMPVPSRGDWNKYQLPSFTHWDGSLKCDVKKGPLKKLSAEVLMAYRFLSRQIGTNESFRINKVDFFHFDFIVGYRL